MTAHEVCRQCGKPIVTAFGPAIFDRDILALDGAGFRQALVERRYEMCIRTGRSAVEIADHWRCRLLRAHCGRPNRRDPIQRGYEFSPSDVGCHATLPLGSCPCNGGHDITL